MKKSVSEIYASYYQQKKYEKIYPGEFVVRSFLQEKPRLQMEKPKEGSKVIDVSGGYGRHLLFLCDQWEKYGLSGVYAT